MNGKLFSEFLKMFLVNGIVGKINFECLGRLDQGLNEVFNRFQFFWIDRFFFIYRFLFRDGFSVVFRHLHTFFDYKRIF